MKKAKKTAKKTKKVAAKKPAAKAKAAPKKAVAAHKPKAAKPARPARAVVVEDKDRPPKLLKLSKDDATKFKKLLLDLRDHLIDGVNFLASDNLKRSNREASGELSGYSLHMADAGTDNFDREFALSLVSNEQEALYEIEEALRRLDSGTYGLCGNCERPVRKERLEAVPFARLCVDCQSLIEKDRRRPNYQGPTFAETSDDEGGDSEDSEE